MNLNNFNNSFIEVVVVVIIIIIDFKKKYLENIY